jgi:hypothetical protein
VSGLTTSVAATSLVAVGGVESVAVASRKVSAGRTVAWILAIGIIGLWSLGGEPLRGGADLDGGMLRDLWLLGPP